MRLPPSGVAIRKGVLLVGVARGRFVATNRTSADEWVFAITVGDGKLTKIREYLDTQALRGPPRRTPALSPWPAPGAPS